MAGTSWEGRFKSEVLRTIGEESVMLEIQKIKMNWFEHCMRRDCPMAFVKKGTVDAREREGENIRVGT